MATKKLLAAFGFTGNDEIKQEDEPTAVADVETKTNDNEFSEEEWVKVEEALSSEASTSHLDEDPLTGTDSERDEVPDKERSSINEDINELTESVAEIDLVKDEGLNKEISNNLDQTKQFTEFSTGYSSDEDELLNMKIRNINEETKQLADFSTGYILEKDEVLNTEISYNSEDTKDFLDSSSEDDDVFDVHTNKFHEDTKHLVEQVKENKENNIPIVHEQFKNTCEQNGERKMRQVTFIISDIPASYPIEKVVVVNNTLPGFRRYDYLAVFKQFGNITYIQKMKFSALVAFSTKEEAQNAAKAKHVEICGRKVFVRLRDYTKRYREYPSDQVVFVFDVLPYYPDEKIRNYFEQDTYLKVERIQNYRCRNGINRIVFFDKPLSTEHALKFDNTYMGLSKIRVKPRGARAENYYEGRSVIIFKENEDDQPDERFLKFVFGDFGRIEDLDMLGNKKKLAVITFKDEMGAKKSLKVNAEDKYIRSIRVVPYTEARYSRTKIIIHNIAPDVTEKDIMNFFKGKVIIDRIHFETGRPFALIETLNTDEYCKAFRLNSDYLHGQSLYMKPFSDTDESLENILYNNYEFVAIWGDKLKKKRNRN